MIYLYLKALHIIFIVCYFAGLFYIVRLFVYYCEANQKTEIQRTILQDQYRIMSSRLWYIITVPAGILALIFGVLMFVYNPALLKLDWIHMKLVFIVVLLVYHFKTQQFVNNIKNKCLTKTPIYFRFYNEGATLILFSVIFLVILKNAFNWIYGLIGLFSLALLLMIGIKLYKKVRERKK